jgi:tetratricopeptide (TPR) repeat protein
MNKIVSFNFKQVFRTHLFFLLTSLFIFSNCYSQYSCKEEADSLFVFAKKPKEALDVILNCDRKKDAKYYEFVGRCYQMIDEKEAITIYSKLTIRNYEKCLALDKNNYYANSCIGDFNLNNTKFKKALKNYQNALLDSLTFKKCNFFPTYLYGDIAIAYLHMDSLKKSNEYFKKIIDDKDIYTQSRYFNHWLDLNLKSNYLSDTTLYKIIYPLINTIDCSSKQDSIEVMSILYLLDSRIRKIYPNWNSNFVDLSPFYEISEYNVDHLNTLMKYVDPSSCQFPYTIFLLSNYFAISKEKYLKYIKNTPYERVFAFYTPQ